MLNPYAAVLCLCLFGDDCRLCAPRRQCVAKIADRQIVTKLKPYLCTNTRVKLRAISAICVLLFCILACTMEFDKFLTLGKTLGLEGKDLVDFAHNRELKAEKQREKLEIQKREQIQREEKLAKEEADRAERAKERAHAKEMKEFELEFEQQKKGQAEKGQSEQNPRVKKPKLPSFSDGRDDMDAYLRRFERFAATAKWQKNRMGASFK